MRNHPQFFSICSPCRRGKTEGEGLTGSQHRGEGGRVWKVPAASLAFTPPGLLEPPEHASSEGHVPTSRAQGSASTCHLGGGSAFRARSGSAAHRSPAQNQTPPDWAAGRAERRRQGHWEDPAGSLVGSPDQAVQRASRTGPSVAIAPTPPACSFPTAVSPQNPTSSHPPGLTVGQPGTLGLRGSGSKLHCST